MPASTALSALDSATNTEEPNVAKKPKRTKMLTAPFRRGRKGVKTLISEHAAFAAKREKLHDGNTVEDRKKKHSKHKSTIRSRHVKRSKSTSHVDLVPKEEEETKPKKNIAAVPRRLSIGKGPAGALLEELASTIRCRGISSHQAESPVHAGQFHPLSFDKEQEDEDIACPLAPTPKAGTHQRTRSYPINIEDTFKNTQTKSPAAYSRSPSVVDRRDSRMRKRESHSQPATSRSFRRGSSATDSILRRGRSTTRRLLPLDQDEKDAIISIAETNEVDTINEIIDDSSSKADRDSFGITLRIKNAIPRSFTSGYQALNPCAQVDTDNVSNRLLVSGDIFSVPLGCEGRQAPSMDESGGSHISSTSEENTLPPNPFEISPRLRAALAMKLNIPLKHNRVNSSLSRTTATTRSGDQSDGCFMDVEVLDNGAGDHIGVDDCIEIASPEEDSGVEVEYSTHGTSAVVINNGFSDDYHQFMPSHSNSSIKNIRASVRQKQHQQHALWASVMSPGSKPVDKLDKTYTPAAQPVKSSTRPPSDSFQRTTRVRTFRGRKKRSSMSVRSLSPRALPRRTYTNV